MDFTLKKIKRLVRTGRYEFSEKARNERAVDGLLDGDVVESILNADRIEKIIRSTSPKKQVKRELLYVIHAPSNDETWVYTKGAIREKQGQETYYFLVSSKRLE